LPLDEHGAAPGLFKVWGSSASDVWVVGDRGVVLHGNAAHGFARIASGSEQDRLFTVHGAADRVVMVGGSANGWALETGNDGLVDISPPGAAPLQGVCISARGELWTVGVAGNVYVRAAGQSEWRDRFTGIAVQSLHAVWVDPQGGVWAVGGNVLTTDLDRGVALHLEPR
jgi:streptogramin lyase